MSRKKKERLAPIQFTLFSLVCLFLCWIGVTLVAFIAGYALGNAEKTRTAGRSFPVYERAGEGASPSSLTFPGVLGKTAPDFRDPGPVSDPLFEDHPAGKAPAEPSGVVERKAGQDVIPGSTALRPEAPHAPGDRLIQVASFRQAKKAERMVQTLRGKGYRSFYSVSAPPQGSGPSLCRVFVGPFSSLERAGRIKSDLENNEGFHGLFIRSGTP